MKPLVNLGIFVGVTTLVCTTIAVSTHYLSEAAIDYIDSSREKSKKK